MTVEHFAMSPRSSNNLRKLITLQPLRPLALLFLGGDDRLYLIAEQQSPGDRPMSQQQLQ